MKQIKKITAVAIIFIMIVMSFGTVAAQAPEIKIPNPTAEFYSNDFANILNDSTEREIVSLGESLFKATEGGQVVFVSIETLNGNTIEEYANELFNKWKIGTKDKGVLFILSMQERESRIEVGYGYEGVLTDLQSNKLLVKFAELNNEQGIDAAVKTIYTDISSIVSGNEDIVQYPSNTQPRQNTSTSRSFFEENPILSIILGIIVLILIILDFIFTGGRVTFFILRMAAYSARRGGGGGGGGRSSGGGGRSGGGGSSGRF
ncbi:MAG: Psb32 and founding s of phosphatase family protein [Clostridia bacterium]|jgi:uncharacterized protein|nr:Psb32 and founding s of phosphatase family protein [Clostridia bacterium]